MGGFFLFGSISCRDFFVCRINPPSDHQKKWHMEKNTWWRWTSTKRKCNKKKRYLSMINIYIHIFIYVQCILYINYINPNLTQPNFFFPYMNLQFSPKICFVKKIPTFPRFHSFMYYIPCNYWLVWDSHHGRSSHDLQVVRITIGQDKPLNLHPLGVHPSK